MKILASIAALIVAAYLLAQIFFPQGVSFVGCGVGRANSCEDYGAYLLEERDYEAAKSRLKKLVKQGWKIAVLSRGICITTSKIYIKLQKIRASPRGFIPKRASWEPPKHATTPR